MNTEYIEEIIISPLRKGHHFSQYEINSIVSLNAGKKGQLLRHCALAVLNTGSVTDDPTVISHLYTNFTITPIATDRGLNIKLNHAPTYAFVDGELITGIKEHLFAIIRDLLFIEQLETTDSCTTLTPDDITNTVFHQVRNAGIINHENGESLVACWGGHAINPVEYDYSKEVGYELGLRHFDICTGSGPGAMKGPMKGATIGWAKQRLNKQRLIGLTEIGIIAAEPPNAIVKDLITFPDIEKRLEGFVRMAHGIIVFPGGVGTTEEILYLLAILLEDNNRNIPFPFIFTGPTESVDYFEMLDSFIGKTLGPEAQSLYKIIISDASAVAQHIKNGLAEVKAYRASHCISPIYNWALTINKKAQLPFTPTHQSMAALELKTEQPTHNLAQNLCHVFSGIVSGNVKLGGIKQIQEKGPFIINGDPSILAAIDELLNAYIQSNRMKLPSNQPYQPCYRIHSK
jgi:predicted Rossmann-fold nucleotide-binding protein